ncbi:MAG: preprotein translocase subunit YajC [Puniceicoccales bacterium]|jgi:preprotein translocase subunit YajC|nr:preprotein translocase subunit YajC [Puniceicoccales bacterium]
MRGLSDLHLAGSHFHRAAADLPPASLGIHRGASDFPLTNLPLAVTDFSPTDFRLAVPDLPLAVAEGPVAAPNGGISMLIFLLLFAGMWFLMIAPQRKRQKQHAQMIQELKSGDEVMTSAGIYASIVAVRPDRFVVKIADNVKIEIHKSSVQCKLSKEAESSEKSSGNSKK